MMALVWSVIGIGLVAALLFGGISLFNPDASTLAQVRDNTTSAFQGVASAYHAYVNANDVAPTTAGWYAELVPGFLPDVKYPIPDTLWSYGTDVTYGDYFCLYGTMSIVAYNGALTAAANFPTNVLVVSPGACGERSAVLVFGGFPRSIYITYWLRGS